MLTENEIRLIERAACDIATGHHLICKRTPEQLAMLREVCECLSLIDDGMPDMLNRRQKEIYEQYRLCTDYSYAKSKGLA